MSSGYNTPNNLHEDVYQGILDKLDDLQSETNFPAYIPQVNNPPPPNSLLVTPSITSKDRLLVPPRPGCIAGPSTYKDKTQAFPRWFPPPTLINPLVPTVSLLPKVTPIASTSYCNPISIVPSDSEDEPDLGLLSDNPSEDIAVPTVAEETMTKQLAQATSSLGLADPFIGQQPTATQLASWYESTYQWPGTVQGPFPPPLPKKGKAKTMLPGDDDEYKPSSMKEILINKLPTFTSDHAAFSGWLVSIKTYLGVNCHILWKGSRPWDK
ncbi:hypothetical protein J3A83DRAFT_4383408 [Scleroderma citrinum]